MFVVNKKMIRFLLNFGEFEGNEYLVCLVIHLDIRVHTLYTRTQVNKTPLSILLQDSQVVLITF